MRLGSGGPVGQHRRGTKMKRIVGLFTVFTMIGLVFAGCGAVSGSSASSSATQAVTTTTSVTVSPASVTTEERAFLVQWIPDIRSYRSLIPLVKTGNAIAASGAYDSLQRLSQKWGSYAAPSARTEMLLSEWSTDVQILEDVAKLAMEGNVDAARPIFGSLMARAAEKEKLDQGLGDLALELGVVNLLGDLSTTSTLQSTTTIRQPTTTAEATTPIT